MRKSLTALNQLKTAWLLVFVLAITTDAEQWKIISDFRDVREVVYADGRLYCATSGGLAEFDPETELFILHDPADGFAGIGVSALAEDGAGGLWLAFDNGRLQRFEPGRGVTHSVQSLGPETGITHINRMTVSPWGIFLATNCGIARVIYSEAFDRWVWREDFRQLGEFPPEQEALCLCAQDSLLWVGTAIGVAVTNLGAQSRVWRSFTMESGFPALLVKDLIVFDGRVLAATDQRVLYWSGTSWRTFVGSSDVRRFQFWNDSLRVVRSAGVYTWLGGSWQRDTAPRSWISSLAYDDRQRIWCGMMFDNGAVYRGGLTRANGQEDWTEFIPEGPTSGLAADFAFFEDGGLAMIGGFGKGHYGLGIFNGRNWQRWTAPDYVSRPFLKQHIAVAADLDGGVWTGTWGSGLVYYPLDDTVLYYDYSPETGRRLIGYNEAHIDDALIGDLTVDHAGNLWVLNRSAVNGKELVCVPRSFIQNPDSEAVWIYFHRVNFKNFPHFDRIAVDALDRIWIAASTAEPIDGKGVWVLDPHGTPEDSTDDRVWGPLPGLGSAQVLSLAWDPAGYMWAGTIEGAYYITASTDDISRYSFTGLYPLRDNQVNSIDIDAMGNKWFGTTFGVTIVAPDLFTVQRRITDDAPDKLPGTTVNVVRINPVTGWAYFGTDKGTAAVQTPYRYFGETLADVTIEPNPFNPNRGRLRFTGSSLGAQAEASIFTPDGRLVRRLTHEEAALGWDGLTDSGRPAVNGVYLIVTHNSSGKAARGKVALIRK